MPLPRHLLGVNDQPEQMEVEVLETATNSGAEHGGKIDELKGVRYLTIFDDIYGDI